MGSNIVRFDSIRSTPIASITAAYTAFGSAFGHAMRVLHFTNDSNGVYFFSFDGINDNIVVTPNSFALYDLTSDQDSNEMFRYQQGSQLYIKSIVAPTSQTGSSNTMYVAAVYGKGE